MKRAHAQGRAEQLVHDPQADQRRLRRRAGAGRGQGALPRRADRRRRGRRPSAPRARAPPRCRSPTRTCRRCSTSRRRSPTARRRSSRTARTTCIYEDYHCRRVRFGDVEQGFAEADHVFEWRYQSAPIEHAPTETTGCIVEPQARRAAEDHVRHAGVLLHARQHGADPRRAVRQAAGRRRDGRRRLRRQGRRDGRADRVHRRDGHQPAGEVRLRPRRGDAGLLPARGRADLHQGRRDERRADRRPPGAAVRRRRRVLAPQPVRRHQGRGAHARAVHDPERLRGLLVRVHEPHAVVAPCAGSA